MIQLYTVRVCIGYSLTHTLGYQVNFIEKAALENVFFFICCLRVRVFVLIQADYLACTSSNRATLKIRVALKICHSA